MLFFTKAKRAQNVNDYESWNEGGVAPTLNAMDNNGEAFATVLIANETRGYKKTWAEKDEESWEETKIARILTIYDNGYESRSTMLAGNDSVVRRLTPVECERLQGFPDNWTDGQADSNRYKQMGNAVAVPVVQWIINRMVEAIKE